MSVDKFNRPAIRAAFRIWPLEGSPLADDAADFSGPDQEALKVMIWPVSDSGRHRDKEGIYLHAHFGGELSAVVTISFTRKQLQALVDELNSRYPEAESL